MRLIDADSLKVQTVTCSYIDGIGEAVKGDIPVVSLEDLETAPCVEVKSVYHAGRDEAVAEIIAIIEEIETRPSGFMLKLDTCYLIKQRIKAMFNY